ncbi:unnamed protein product [Sphagnum jensenii]|uniref:Uncharacterized protein n=1 Tax=Sphagnum jensenii TaxID=128206 RepID=A0ABP0ZX60_9BRYO
MERNVAVTLESASSEILKSVESIDDKSEFGNTKLEELVLKDGPQQILQLMLQDQADDFMREEITDIDDYVDWIQWVSEAEKGKHANMEATRCTEVHVLLQIHQVSGSDAHFNRVRETSCGAAMLQLAMLWCCDVATLRRCGVEIHNNAALRCCNVVVRVVATL